jgi:NAD(P)H-dependent flavin oxidoreductase YrpB (nitropropane dioxygenase family)
MTPRSDEAEALLARLHNNHVHKFVARSDEELRAHIAAAIEAARVPWERDDALRRDIAASCGDDDDDLVAPAPVPPRRQRKRSLAKVCEAARKAGADHVIVDGVVIALSPAAAAPESDVSEWDAVLPEVDHGPH